MSTTSTSMIMKSFLFPKQALLAAGLVFSACGLMADPIRVADSEAMKSVLQKVRPEYPPIAKQLKLSGRVVVDLTVAEDGTVEKADVVAGNPILGNAAKNAGKNWKFTPFQADGKSSKAVIRINFDFAN